MAALLEGRHAHCEQVTLVLDNLDPHVAGALYETFGAERGERLPDRIKFRYTPKHGNWLNVAERESDCLTRQCLRCRRIGELDQLRSEAAARAAGVNQRQRGVNWHMSVDDARCKLKSVYPKITD